MQKDREEEILKTYCDGNTMFKTAQILGITLDEVRRVIIKHKAGRLTHWDRSFINSYEHAPGIPARKR